MAIKLLEAQSNQNVDYPAIERINKEKEQLISDIELKFARSIEAVVA
jgi:hypothetical protein